MRITEMHSALRLADGMLVAALAGRRIDAEGATTLRFPLAHAPTVKSELRDLMKRERVGLLVCSAACGADLLALDAALELGARCRIVIPYGEGEFYRTSVADRPGEWTALYESVITNVSRKGDLVVLSGSPGDESSYRRANEAIVTQAAAAAAPGRALAILVWEGRPREGSDATEEFLHLALSAGMLERTVRTCSPPGAPR